MKYPRRETVDDCEGIANERRCVAGSRNIPPRPSLSLRSTKDTGTGLGLPLAKRAIEDNGGTLVLAEARDSAGASGAEFIIEIPLAPDA